MKKIKRFVVNVLSPEEMRQVTVGRAHGCYTGQCFVYLYDANKVLKGTYWGTCGAYDSIKQCVCQTSVGNYYAGYACGKWKES
ncbi:MAG: hypothetical protein K2O61_09380 [Bacteroidaceae bacterium]|nr:hypothetical protein [Bacteroidaceae bacterium]